MRTNLFVPAPAKLLYGDGDGILFVQVHVLTNPEYPFSEKIVRERLTEFSLLNSVIRLLRGVIAGYSSGCFPFSEKDAFASGYRGLFFAKAPFPHIRLEIRLCPDPSPRRCRGSSL